MTQLGVGVAGQVFFIETEAWHPWQYSQRMGRNVHAYLQWYMRFQNTMTTSQMPNGAGGHWNWGTGSAQWVLDRESIATHEFGHTIALMHPDQINYSDPQTMHAYYDGIGGDRTGIHWRTPSMDDSFGFHKLYPNPIQ